MKTIDDTVHAGPTGVIVLEDGRPHGVRPAIPYVDGWLKHRNNGCTMLDGGEFEYDRIVIKFTLNFHRAQRTDDVGHDTIESLEHDHYPLTYSQIMRVKREGKL